jgi:hypothetical protein
MCDFGCAFRTLTLLWQPHSDSFWVNVKSAKTQFKIGHVNTS